MPIVYSTGFKYFKGRPDSDLKGHYYSAFFHLSIGLERMMKLIYISHHRLEGDYTAINEKSLRNLGHNLIKLYENSAKIAVKYDNKSFWG